VARSHGKTQVSSTLSVSLHKLCSSTLSSREENKNSITRPANSLNVLSLNLKSCEVWGKKGDIHPLAEQSTNPQSGWINLWNTFSHLFPGTNFKELFPCQSRCQKCALIDLCVTTTAAAPPALLCGFFTATSGVPLG